MGGAVSSVFKGLGSVFGLGNQKAQYTINQDPNAVAAATAQANEAADLSADNTPTVQSGGATTSTSSSLASRRRKSSTGVSSNLGIGS